MVNEPNLSGLVVNRNVCSYNGGRIPLGGEFYGWFIVTGEIQRPANRDYVYVDERARDEENRIGH